MFPLKRNFHDKILMILQVTNNALKILITNGTISLNQRLEIRFMRRL